MEKSEKKQPMIRIRGANENNLKSVDLDIPRNQGFICFFTRVFSGSREKSSLAFDTIYAEGQRRYMESHFLLCQTVFRTDGETGCGEYRRTSAGDFHRPEINQPQSEIYGGNGDRNL